MTLKIREVHHFDWSICCRLPGDNQEHQFQARFLELSHQQIRTFLNDKEKGGKRLLEKIFIGWKDIVNEQDIAIPFSHEQRTLLLERPYLATALIKAYMRAMFASDDDVGEVQRKNC